MSKYLVPSFILFHLVYYEMESCQVGQAGLELLILTIY